MAITNSYDSRRDVYYRNFEKSGAPGRDMIAVNMADDLLDTTDLGVYGKVVVFNAGVDAEILRVVPVAKQDDSQFVDLKIPPGLTYIDFLIVRAIRKTGSGLDLTVYVVTT